MYIFCSYIVEFERWKGTALISSIYGLADMAMVGRHHGPDGSAAMAVTEALVAAYVIYSLIKENRKEKIPR